MAITNIIEDIKKEGHHHEVVFTLNHGSSPLEQALGDVSTSLLMKVVCFPYEGSKYHRKDLNLYARNYGIEFNTGCACIEEDVRSMLNKILQSADRITYIDNVNWQCDKDSVLLFKLLKEFYKLNVDFK